MRIAVFGSSGVAGSAFCALARARGYVVPTDRADILDPIAVARFVANSDVVVHLATAIPSATGQGSWPRNDRIRREGTANLLSACEKHSSPPMVVLQSIGMLHCQSDRRAQNEEDPLCGYGVLESALDMEQMGRDSTLDVRIVRGGLFYGPQSGRVELWQSQLTSPDFRIPGDGTAWLTGVHVEDFAAALLCVIERAPPNSTWIACDDIALQSGPWFERLALASGLPAPQRQGATTLRSFRLTNAKLKTLGWLPKHQLQV
jgi:nucleoside-diphosphate-sugar epimerase